MCTRTQGKKAGPHRDSDRPTCPLQEDLLAEAGMAVAHCRNKDSGSSNSVKYSLVSVLLEARISPPKQPISFSGGSPQSQTANRTGTHPTSLSMALPKRGTKHSSVYNRGGTSPSHQKACTNRLRQPHTPESNSRSKNYNPVAYKIATENKTK